MAETLTNAARHAHASAVTVTVRSRPRHRAREPDDPVIVLVGRFKLGVAEPRVFAVDLPFPGPPDRLVRD